MPDTYSPQVYARSARSALLSALRTIDPICRASDDDALIGSLSIVRDELDSAEDHVSRALAVAEAAAALHRVQGRELSL